MGELLNKYHGNHEVFKRVLSNMIYTNDAKKGPDNEDLKSLFWQGLSLIRDKFKRGKEAYDPLLRVKLSENIINSAMTSPLKERLLFNLEMGQPVVYNGYLIAGDESNPLKEQIKKYVHCMKKQIGNNKPEYWDFFTPDNTLIPEISMDTDYFVKVSSLPGKFPGQQ